MQVRLRAVASGDIDAALTYYLDEAGAETAAAFIDELQVALDHMRDHPHSGSLRFAYELEIPDLRCWALGTFPYLAFYVVAGGSVDVWRVLHTRRDLPGHLA